MQPRFLVITSLDSKLIQPEKSLPNINLNAWLNKIQTCLKMQSKMLVKFNQVLQKNKNWN